jgi:hypothetical protein
MTAFLDTGDVKPIAGFRNFTAGVSGGDHHVQRLARHIPQICQGGKTVHFGHVDIQQENIGLPLSGLDQNLQSVACGFDIEAHPDAAVGNGSQNAGVVIGNEDLRRGPG